MRGEECDTCGARADNPDELLISRSQRHHSILAEMLMRRNVTVCKYFVLYRRSRRAGIGRRLEGSGVAFAEVQQFQGALLRHLRLKLLLPILRPSGRDVAPIP
jgi:hypothetical protein